jgi:iron complex transport system substrate-binding protein
MIAGCSGGEQQNEGGESAGTAASDSARIISLHPIVTEVVFALGADEKLVARDQSSTFPEAAEALPEVGYYRLLEAEKILNYNPTKLLTTAETGPPPVLEQVTSAGVEVAKLAPPEDLDAVGGFIRAVGDAINQPDTAGRLAEQVSATIDSVRQMADAMNEQPGVMCLYDRGGLDNLYLLGAGTPTHALITGAGARQAVDFEGHKSISPETVIAAEPEVLLLPARTLELIGGSDAIASHPILGKTPAAKNGRLVTLPSVLFFVLGAHTGETLLNLHQQFTAGDDA